MRSPLLSTLLLLSALLLTSACGKAESPEPSEPEATITPTEGPKFVKKAPTRKNSKIRVKLGESGTQGAAKQCKALAKERKLRGGVCRVHKVDQVNVVCSCNHF